VSLRANEPVVFDRHRVVARHPRITRRYHYRDDLDHYLEILLTKPGALAGSTALAQARTDGTFTPTHDAFWAAARAAHGDAPGTRALIEVLLLHRRMPAEAVLSGIAGTLEAGATSPDVVAIEARKAHRDEDTPEATSEVASADEPRRADPSALQHDGVTDPARTGRITADEFGDHLGDAEGDHRADVISLPTRQHPRRTVPLRPDLRRASPGDDQISVLNIYRPLRNVTGVRSVMAVGIAHGYGHRHAGNRRAPVRRRAL